MAPRATANVDLTQTQLFLDNTWVADSFRVRRQWQQAKKYPYPVLKPEHPWECEAALAYGTVLQWRGRFHLWYRIWSDAQPGMICYAHSDNGIDWHRPALGLHEVLGSRENNVVLTADPGDEIDCISVIDDPQDKTWPLKALFYVHVPRGKDTTPAGHWAARSKDGIHWEKIGNVLPTWGDRFNAASTKIDGYYVQLGRDGEAAKRNKGRTVSYTRSKDLRKWSKGELVLANDIEDPEAQEVYSATLFPYADWIVGSIERMHMCPDTLDVEIIFSRDGKSWQRSRTPHSFIKLGAEGHWDDTWINLTSNAPIDHAGQLWFYYSGRTSAHGAMYPHKSGAIGLATLRYDGFCSLHAGELPGWLLTEPMTWPDADLLINADPRRDLAGHPTEPSCGEVRIEVRDERNEPIKGFTAADCKPIVRNTRGWARSMAPMWWGEAKRSLRQLRGKRIRLHLTMREAHLYAFRAGDAPR